MEQAPPKENPSRRFGAKAEFQRRDGEMTAGRHMREPAEVRRSRGVCD